MIVKTVEVLRTEFIKITYGVGGGEYRTLCTTLI